jgi:hypothetical protein
MEDLKAQLAVVQTTLNTVRPSTGPLFVCQRLSAVQLLAAHQMNLAAVPAAAGAAAAPVAAAAPAAAAVPGAHAPVPAPRKYRASRGMYCDWTTCMELMDLCHMFAVAALNQLVKARYKALGQELPIRVDQKPESKVNRDARAAMTAFITSDQEIKEFMQSHNISEDRIDISLQALRKSAKRKQSNAANGITDEDNARRTRIRKRADALSHSLKTAYRKANPNLDEATKAKHLKVG